MCAACHRAACPVRGLIITPTARRREIITLQLGPCSNWVGAHFWNVQDEAFPQPKGEDEDEVPEDEAADPNILYQSRRSERGWGSHTPRLIICDAADNFGSLGTQGRHNQFATMSEEALDPLSWSGSVTQVVRDPREMHPFVAMMHAPVMGSGWESAGGAHHLGGDRDGDREAAAKEGEDDGEEAQEGGDAKGVEGVEGEEGEEGEEGVKAAGFRFEESVSAWSDYLQARLHPRTLAPLRPHAHDFSSFQRFPDGAVVVEKVAPAHPAAHAPCFPCAAASHRCRCPLASTQEDDTEDRGGPALAERVRRALEESDSVQGFTMVVDTDSGYGGMGVALLTRIRDEFTRAPCFTYGVGMLQRPPPPSEDDDVPTDPHSYTPGTPLRLARPAR